MNADIPYLGRQSEFDPAKLRIDEQTGNVGIGTLSTDTGTFHLPMATLHIVEQGKEVVRICSPDPDSETPWTVRTPNGLVARFVAKSDAELFARIIAREFLAKG